MSQYKVPPTSVSWPSVLGRELPPWLGPGQLLCPAPASGWKSSLQRNGRGAERAPVGHRAMGEALTGAFSHQNTCTHIKTHCLCGFQFCADFSSVQSHQGCAAISIPNTSTPGWHSPLGSGGGIRPSLTFSCSSFWASRRVWRRNFFCSFFVKYTPRVTGVSLSTGREMRPSAMCPGGSRGSQGSTRTLAVLHRRVGAA